MISAPRALLTDSKINQSAVGWQYVGSTVTKCLVVADEWIGQSTLVRGEGDVGGGTLAGSLEIGQSRFSAFKFRRPTRARSAPADTGTICTGVVNERGDERTVRGH